MMRRAVTQPRVSEGARGLSQHAKVKLSLNIKQFKELDDRTVDVIERTIKRFQDAQFSLVTRRASADHFNTFDPRSRTLDSVKGSRMSFNPKNVPPSLVNRKVELTGPASDASMVITALNSAANGVSCFMGDAEDASTMSEANTLSTLRNNYGIARRTLKATKGDKEYALNGNESDLATYIFRPPGLHLPLPCVTADDKPVSAFLFHTAAYAAQNGNELLSRGQGPYLYIPKLEGKAEAAFVNEVFSFIESEMQWKKGTMKATVLVETWPTLVELPGVIESLLADEHIVGINAARWDYLFSLHKHFGRTGLFPARHELTMEQPFMREYVKRIVSVGHHYGIHAIGGMSAYIPSKDEGQNAVAMANATTDKQREFDAGLDGCWIAHPGMAGIRKIFDATPEPHQISSNKSIEGTAAISDLAPRFQNVNINLADVRKNIRIGVEYLSAWMSGTGAVALNGMMEDAATMEISRYNLWNHRHFGAAVKDGNRTLQLTPALVKKLIAEQVVALKAGDTQVPYAKDFFEKAASVFQTSVLSDAPPAFLTLPALSEVALAEGLPGVLHKDIHTFCPSKIASHEFGPEKVANFGHFTHRGVRLATYRGEALTQLLAAHEAPVVFFGAYTGPVAQQYANYGVHLYGGGWQNNAANNAQRTPYPDTLFVTPGDLYNTAEMFNNYMEAAKINQELTLSTMTPEKKAAFKQIDYESISVMLDGENGFGSEDKIIDMVRNLVKRGVNLIHIEDQIEKRCGHIGGKSVHKTETLRRHYESARWVLNQIEAKENTKVLGNVRIAARTDCLDAKFFDGSANFPSFNSQELLEAFVEQDIDEVSSRGIVELLIRAEYLRPNKANVRFTSKFSADSYSEDLALGHYSAMKTPILRAIEQSRFVPLDYKFVDWDKGHTPDGRFWYLREDCGMKFSIHRMINVMDLADIGWMETKDPVVDELKEFVEGVRNFKNEFGERPFKDFVVLYNLSPSFNWQYNFGKQAAPLTKTLIGKFKTAGAAVSSLSESDGAKWVRSQISAAGDTHDFSEMAVRAIFNALHGTTINHVDRLTTLRRLISDVRSHVQEGKLSTQDASLLETVIGTLTSEQVQTEKVQKLLADEHMRLFSSEIFKCGASLQLITLPEFHFDMIMAARLAHSFVKEGQGMLAYSHLVQEPEFEMRDKHGYDGVTHQRKAMLDYWQEILRLLNPDRPDLVKKAGESHTEGQMSKDWRKE